MSSDGGVGSLRALLGDLEESIAVEALSIRTPDLDDVFFALTGQAITAFAGQAGREERRHEPRCPYAATDSATMLRRNLRHMQRYPSLTL